MYNGILKGGEEKGTASGGQFDKRELATRENVEEKQN